MAIDDGFIANLIKGDRPTVSFEFFPPKDEPSFQTLLANFEKLMRLAPDFVSVTYGAMGSNQASSLAVVTNFAKRVPTIAHLTCIGSTQEKIVELLRLYEAEGVAGVLALRGDVPASYEGQPLGDFETANELVELARRRSALRIGVAAFPEKHPESKSLAHDVKVLKLKQDSGASFAITQMFFDIEAYFSLVTSAQAAGVTMPIIPGVMPISNARQVLRMAEMSGAKVPELLISEFAASNNEDHARKIGMDFSIGLSKKLLAGGAPGLHVFTLNQFAAANELLEGVAGA